MSALLRGFTWICWFNVFRRDSSDKTHRFFMLKTIITLNERQKRINSTSVTRLRFPERDDRADFLHIADGDFENKPIFRRRK